MNRRYVYRATNKISLALSCAVVVLLGSLFVYWLTPDGYDGSDILKRIAWPVWGLAFVIRALQYLFRRPGR